MWYNRNGKRNTYGYSRLLVVLTERELLCDSSIRKFRQTVTSQRSQPLMRTNYVHVDSEYVSCLGIDRKGAKLIGNK